MSQQIPSIYVNKSKLQGLGVFTSSDIPEEGIIEISPILYIPSTDIPLIKKTIINNYYFEWDEDSKAGVLALGYGSIYNHSYTPNAYYDMDMPGGTISFYAYRDIKAGEEITINYNGAPDDDKPIWFDAI